MKSAYMTFTLYSLPPLFLFSAHTKNGIKHIKNARIENKNLQKDEKKPVEEPKASTSQDDKNETNQNTFTTPKANVMEKPQKQEENKLNAPAEQKENAKPLAGEKYLVEHIQLNRFTIEKLNPEVMNLSRTKYRGVCNYNPRVNPDVHAEIANAYRKTNVNEVPAKLASTSKSLDNNNNDDAKSTDNTLNDSQKKEKSINQYIELLSLDDSTDLTTNTESFECSICWVDYKPLDGVVLRNCLHCFCKDCVRNTIIYSDDAEVKCPYIDKEYTCEYLLQDREIKALLTEAEYDEHLAKSLRIAENQIENSFHCRTPNCKGWCIYEDDVNVFKCPICQLLNCLTCRVIHDGLNCQQYQNMMKKNLENNPENATTLNMLDDMIKNGEAMNCPTCRVSKNFQFIVIHCSIVS